MAVLLWVAGFDIIYACQDVEFGRAVPTAQRAGSRRACERRCAWRRCCHLAMVLVLLALPLGHQRRGTAVAFGMDLLDECRGGRRAAGRTSTALVRPDDLSRVNTAFFQVNAIISIGLFACRHRRLADCDERIGLFFAAPRCGKMLHLPRSSAATCRVAGARGPRVCDGSRIKEAYGDAEVFDGGGGAAGVGVWTGCSNKAEAGSRPATDRCRARRRAAGRRQPDAGGRERRPTEPTKPAAASRDEAGDRAQPDAAPRRRWSGESARRTSRAAARPGRDGDGPAAAGRRWPATRASSVRRPRRAWMRSGPQRDRRMSRPRLSAVRTAEKRGAAAYLIGRVTLQDDAHAEALIGLLPPPTTRCGTTPCRRSRSCQDEQLDRAMPQLVGSGQEHCRRTRPTACAPCARSPNWARRASDCDAGHAAVGPAMPACRSCSVRRIDAIAKVAHAGRSEAFFVEVLQDQLGEGPAAAGRQPPGPGRHVAESAVEA